jgi:glucose/arabinose dehydrogenase
VGEGGLLGLALHPRFAQNGWLYVYFTGFGGSGFRNRVVRYRLAPSGLRERAVILDDIPASPFHDGGRIAFGPDGYLYVGTGDATDGSYSPATESLAGKILRLTDDGKPAPGNPWKSAVYSIGHRNVQGLAWDDRGRLWATEHGRSGMESGLDELNLVTAGANHGWPSIQGDAVRAGITPPVAHSGPTYTWAPSAAAYWRGRILFGGLRGEALYEARIPDDGKTTVRVHFHAELGRIRIVTVGPDGLLYLGTSNRDGRGRERRGDDRIVRMDPEFFDRP